MLCKFQLNWVKNKRKLIKESRPHTYHEYEPKCIEERDFEKIWEHLLIDIHSSQLKNRPPVHSVSSLKHFLYWLWTNVFFYCFCNWLLSPFNSSFLYFKLVFISVCMLWINLKSPGWDLTIVPLKSCQNCRTELISWLNIFYVKRSACVFFSLFFYCSKFHPVGWWSCFFPIKSSIVSFCKWETHLFENKLNITGQTGASHSN